MMEPEHERGSSKHLELRLEVQHNDHEPTKGATTASSEPNLVAKHEDNKSKVGSTISDLQLQHEAKHDHDQQTEGGTSSGLEPYTEVKDDGNEPTLTGSVSNISYSSSSSSSSDGENPLDDSFAKSTPHHQSPSSKPTSLPDVSTHAPQGSMVSASPRAGTGNLSSSENLPPTPEWSMYASSPMKSPHIQTMGRPAGYDPNRIPSSIFSTKPATPMEWSVTSNESLFSIHMGNNSFTRDHAILMGDSKPEEWSNSLLHLSNFPEAKSNDSNSFTSNLPPVFEMATENDTKNGDTGKDSRQAEEIHEPPKTIPAETVKEKDKGKSAPLAEQVHLSTASSNLSEGGGVPPTEGTHTSAVIAARVSNESENSGGSFAFPLLVGDGGKSGSTKEIPEKPEEPKRQPQDPPRSTPKAAETSWFSCLTCWPRCC